MPPPSPGGIPTRLSLPSASRTARQQPRNTHVSSGIFVWALAQGGMQSSPSIITIHGTAQGPILQAPAISKRSCRRHAGAARGSCCPGGAPPRPRPCRSPGSAVREGPSPGSTAAASAPGAPLRPPGAVGAVRPRAPNRGQLRPGEHPGVRSGSQPRPGVRTHGLRALRAPSGRGRTELLAGSCSGSVIPCQPLIPSASSSSHRFREVEWDKITRDYSDF